MRFHPSYYPSYWYAAVHRVAKSQTWLRDWTVRDPMDYTVQGILQARILEWVVVPFSRGSSQVRDQTHSPTLQANSLPIEPQGKPKDTGVGSLFFLLHCRQTLYQLSYQGSLNFHLVKGMVFLVVTYGCESWAIKKTECWRTEALNCGVGEDSWEPLRLQGDPTGPS